MHAHWTGVRLRDVCVTLHIECTTIRARAAKSTVITVIIAVHGLLVIIKLMIWTFVAVHRYTWFLMKVKTTIYYLIRSCHETSSFLNQLCETHTVCRIVIYQKSDIFFVEIRCKFYQHHRPSKTLITFNKNIAIGVLHHIVTDNAKQSRSKRYI